jgi:hypothetical protein
MSICFNTKYNQECVDNPSTVLLRRHKTELHKTADDISKNSGKVAVNFNLVSFSKYQSHDKVKNIKVKTLRFLVVILLKTENEESTLGLS